MLGRADHLPDVSSEVHYLRMYDPDADAYAGLIRLTRNKDLALVFDNVEKALECFHAVSKTQPLRPDGKLNRPLTGWHVEVVKNKTLLGKRWTRE